MQQGHKQGNILILLLLLLACLVVAGVLFYKSGKLDSFLGKQDKPAATAATQSQDALSKSDEVEDIERDLSTTNLSETDNVLGEVDIQLNAR